MGYDARNLVLMSLNEYGKNQKSGVLVIRIYGAGSLMATFEIYEESAEERAKKALASHEVVNLYMNGFIIALGQADIAIVMQTNGKIPAVVNMSFTLAKTLVDKLGNTIRDFEMKTGTTIMTTDTVKLKTQTGDGDEEIH